jgi:hypothetical protein
MRKERDQSEALTYLNHEIHSSPSSFYIGRRIELVANFNLALCIKPSLLYNQRKRRRRRSVSPSPLGGVQSMANESRLCLPAKNSFLPRDMSERGRSMAEYRPAALFLIEEKPPSPELLKGRRRREDDVFLSFIPPPPFLWTERKYTSSFSLPPFSSSSAEKLSS